MSSSAPWAPSSSCSGWRSRNPGRLTTRSLTRGLCFIVQEPSVVAPERVAGVNACLAPGGDRLLGGPSGAHGKLLERCLVWKHRFEPGVRQSRLPVRGEGEAGLPQLAQPLWTQPREMDESG